jgi:hypothetical protein
MWEQRQPRPPYVAISHVWSEGMGNPQQNCLPECTVRFIQARGQYGSGNAHFWIDTLCVPTHNKQAKNLAFQKMGQIYSRAEKVLVFDNSLRLASGFTYSEDLYQRSGVSYGQPAYGHSGRDGPYHSHEQQIE